MNDFFRNKFLCVKVQNIPSQNRKRPLADETEKDEVKIPKQDPEDEPNVRTEPRG